ncbi:outer membrane lipoprotein-sorting protein [Algiphilus sp.]|uniref:outer membrane lipoprotein-sorting protein n=1 Tax=Algiphilus sp. TaxID=1872431 RepID=UPI0025C72ED9|nr:outer membrane lipoprotein-sorting protein [Algiphilus sp.]MCK5769680.1 outer membrane lipoprotein-sorting protein [Algiphilus sp.]
MTRISLSLTLAALLAVPVAGAAELSARDIMQKVYDREDGDNAVMDMNMLLIDGDGDTRERQIRSFRRDAPDNPEDSQSIMFFLGPANVEDTGFLTFDYDAGDRDDDQWLYLPALNKVKRIASSDKSGSFMGSDFTYADMSTPDIDDYDYELMKETEVNGHPVWQILATPRSEEEVERTGYTRSVMFVRQDNFVTIRSVNWLEKGDRMKFMEVKELERIDGIWTPTEMVMTTKKGKQTEHASVITWKNIRYNQSLDDDLFSQRRLSQGL